MRKAASSPWLLLAPVATVLLRLPFVLTRVGLYGSDTYLHLRLAEAWTTASAWPALLSDHSIRYLDYEAWPGAQALAASAAEMGADPMVFMRWAPLLALFVLDLALVLVIARKAGPQLAVAGGLLLGLADHLFFQTQWYTPELLGLPLLGALLVNELAVRSRVLSMLVLTALLLTHHLSFVVGLLMYMLLTPREPRRSFLASVAYLVAVSGAFWGTMPDWVGSVNDLQKAAWGLDPGILMAGVVLGLLAGRLALDAVIGKLADRLAGRPLLELLPATWRRAGLIALVVALAAVTVALLAIYRPSAGNEGIGAQPSKLLMLAGGVLFVSFVSADQRELLLGSTFVALGLMLLLNPLLFGAVEVGIRFLEFIYLPGFLVLAAGAHALRELRPRHATAVLVALLLVAPVLLADDAVRYQSEGAQRFLFSDTDFDFARQVRAATPEDATLLAPFDLSAMLEGMADRNASTWSIRKALDARSYVAVEGDLVWLADSTYHPIYLVHSSDRIRYIEEAGDRVTRQDVEALGASIADVSIVLEPIVSLGPHSLYRIPRTVP